MNAGLSGRLLRSSVFQRPTASRLRMRVANSHALSNSNVPPLRAFMLAHPRRLAACPAQAGSIRRRVRPAALVCALSL